VLDACCADSDACESLYCGKKKLTVILRSTACIMVNIRQADESPVPCLEMMWHHCPPGPSVHPVHSPHWPMCKSSSEPSVPHPAGITAISDHYCMTLQEHHGIAGENRFQQSLLACCAFDKEQIRPMRMRALGPLQTSSRLCWLRTPGVATAGASTTTSCWPCRTLCTCSAVIRFAVF